MKLEKLNCPNCNGKLNIEIKNQSQIFCPYCGEAFYVDDGRKEVTINKNININKSVTNRTINEAEILRATLKYKENKQNNIIGLIGIGLIIFMGIAISLCLFISEKVSENKAKKAEETGKISAGFYNDYVDKDYNAVVTQFEVLGFENITTVDLDDSGLAIWNNEKVASVSISGDTSFDNTNYFSPDEPVIISYH